MNPYSAPQAELNSSTDDQARVLNLLSVLVGLSGMFFAVSAASAIIIINMR